MVKWLAECERMFSCSTPKYTESAPAFSAAANESRLPTGAMISKSLSWQLVISYYFWPQRYEINMNYGANARFF